MRINALQSWVLACACSLISLMWAGPSAAQTPSGSGASLSSASASDYRLGGGDTLRVNVYQSPDLSVEVRVSDTGFITFPLLGNLRVGGLSIGETERLIAAGLKKGDYVRNPQVTITLAQAKSAQVSILGQVNRPGRYVLEQTGTRLSDVLAMAGGVIPTLGSDDVTVVGTRNGQPYRQVIDMPKMFESEDRPNDIILQGNEVVYVDRAPVVYVYGEVQRPGQLRLERGMTLLQGLAASGGLTQRGTERGIRIHRKGAYGRIDEIQPPMTEALKNGDVVYVRESLF